MTGEYLGIHADPIEHKCDKPKGSAPGTYATDTVWRCECGLAYRWQYGGAQYSEAWYEWARYAQMDAPDTAR